jgi:hypothetical protein
MAGAALAVDDRDGVTAKTISFKGPHGPLTAHAFIPDRAEPVPGFAFSHSAIQYPDSQTDLLPFARALARGGSAVIMLDGTIDSETRLDNTDIRSEDVACPALWLMSNANLDPDRLVIGGPIKRPFVEPFCQDANKQPCWDPMFYFYWSPDHEENYTRKMKTIEGQLWMIRNLPEELGLKNVNPEWLKPDSASRMEAHR